MAKLKFIPEALLGLIIADLIYILVKTGMLNSPIWVDLVGTLIITLIAAYFIIEERKKQQIRRDDRWQMSSPQDQSS